MEKETKSNGASTRPSDSELREPADRGAGAGVVGEFPTDTDFGRGPVRPASTDGFLARSAPDGVLGVVSFDFDGKVVLGAPANPLAKSIARYVALDEVRADLELLGMLIGMLRG